MIYTNDLIIICRNYFDKDMMISKTLFINPIYYFMTIEWYEKTTVFKKRLKLFTFGNFFPIVNPKLNIIFFLSRIIQICSIFYRLRKQIWIIQFYKIFVHICFTNYSNIGIVRLNQFPPSIILTKGFKAMLANQPSFNFDNIIYMLFDSSYRIYHSILRATRWTFNGHSFHLLNE